MLVWLMIIPVQEYDCLGNNYPDCWIYAHKKSWLTARVDAFMYRLVRHREWGRERIG